MPLRWLLEAQVGWSFLFLPREGRGLETSWLLVLQPEIPFKELTPGSW